MEQKLREVVKEENGAERKKKKIGDREKN